MTTDRQKYAVQWVNRLFSPYKFHIFAPEGFEFFNDDDLEDANKVSAFLSKWLNYAKSVQYDIIEQKQILKEEYDDWFEK